MLRLKAERRSPSTVSGATASESRITKTPDVAHFTTGAPVSSVTPNFWRGLRFALAFDLFLIAFVLFVALAVATVFISVYMVIAVLVVISQMVTG